MCLLVDRLDDYDFFFVVWKSEGEGTKSKDEARKKKSTIKNSLLFFQSSRPSITYLVTSSLLAVLFKNIMPMSSSHFSDAGVEQSA